MRTFKGKYYKVVPAFGDKFRNSGGFFIVLYSQWDNVAKDVLDGWWSDQKGAHEYARKQGLKPL